MMQTLSHTTLYNETSQTIQEAEAPPLTEQVPTENNSEIRARIIVKEHGKESIVEETLFYPMQPRLPYSATDDTITIETDRGVYVGGYKGGMLEGFGSFYFKNGSRYKGEWKKSMRHGFGIMTTHRGGSSYEGEWKDDAPSGYGKMTRSDGSIISGYFSHGFSGTGHIKYTNGDEYKGCFEDAERNGMGLLRTSDGLSFSGEFREGKPWEGVITDKNGRKEYVANGEILS